MLEFDQFHPEDFVLEYFTFLLLSEILDLCHRCDGQVLQFVYRAGSIDILHPQVFIFVV